MRPSPDPAPVTVRTTRPPLDDETLRALRRARILSRRRRAHRLITRL